MSHVEHHAYNAGNTHFYNKNYLILFNQYLPFENIEIHNNERIMV